MSEEKKAEDFQLEELEKPLTEEEMKEKAGGLGVLPPGLQVQVIDGLINLKNPGGSSTFNAGQFGFVPTGNQPPVVVPANPGLQFAPPPVFTPPGATNPGTSASTKNPVGIPAVGKKPSGQN